MQTFLPYPDFAETARVLDNKRLGKQRVEAKQILQINQKVLNPHEYFVCFACKSEFPNKFLGEHWEHSEQQTDHYPLNLQTCRTINSYRVAWENHPAVLQWRGYEEALALYGYVVCKEWIRRGFNDSLLPFFRDQLYSVNWHYDPPVLDITYYPPWYYKDSTIIHNYCESHRSNLVRKDPKYYSEKFPGVPSNLDYIWPSKLEVKC